MDKKEEQFHKIHWGGRAWTNLKATILFVYNSNKAQKAQKAWAQYKEEEYYYTPIDVQSLRH